MIQDDIGIRRCWVVVFILLLFVVEVVWYRKLLGQFCKLGYFRVFVVKIVV